MNSTLERMRAAIAAPRRPAPEAPAPPVPAPAPAPVPAQTPAPEPKLGDEGKPDPKPKARRRPPGKSPEYHDATHATRGRLPDGAAFTARYLGAVRRWVGELAVYGARFEGDASGLFTLMHDLDEKYRAWKRAQPSTASADGAGGIC